MVFYSINSSNWCLNSIAIYLHLTAIYLQKNCHLSSKNCHLSSKTCFIQQNFQIPRHINLRSSSKQILELLPFCNIRILVLNNTINLHLTSKKTFFWSKITNFAINRVKKGWYRGGPIMPAMLIVKGTKYACNLDSKGD